MVMSRWDPFSEALSLRDAMNRLFEQAVLQPSSDGGQRAGGGFAPALDVCETPDDYIVEASLPGVDPKNVEIHLQQGVLTIRGEITDEQHQQQHQGQSQKTNGSQSQGQAGQHHGTYHMRERRTGRFFRSITLPTSVNPDRAEANFNNGILTLTIPKAEETKPRRIQVQSGGASKQASTPQIQSGSTSQQGSMAGTQGGSRTS